MRNMHTHTTKKGALLVAVFAVALVVMSGTTAHAALLVQEDFDGDGSNLAGKTPDFFSGDITLGGDVDGLWDAKSNGGWRRNGDVGVSTDVNTAAHIELGSYIDDARGTASGIFELSMEIAQFTDKDEASAGYISLGFSKASPADNRQFTNSDVSGRATLTRRIEAEDNTVEVYTGKEAGGNTASTTDVLANPQLFTIRLDLTAHNGVDNWGTAAFYIGDSSSGTLIGGSALALDATNSSFPSIALTLLDAQGSIGNLRLEQVPEPATMAMLAIGGVGVLLKRRRRA